MPFPYRCSDRLAVEMTKSNLNTHFDKLAVKMQNLATKFLVHLPHLSLTVHLCVCNRNFIEIQFTYHAVHSFKVHKVVIFNMFLRLFTVLVGPCCFPNSRTWGFWFLCILPRLVITCFLSYHTSKVPGGISLWFWFAFPWSLMMLSIFVCVLIGCLCIFCGEIPIHIPL